MSRFLEKAGSLADRPLARSNRSTMASTISTSVQNSIWCTRWGVPLRRMLSIQAF
jgi:hypothetical protein